MLIGYGNKCCEALQFRIFLIFQNYFVGATGFQFFEFLLFEYVTCGCLVLLSDDVSTNRFLFFFYKTELIALYLNQISLQTVFADHFFIGNQHFVLFRIFLKLWIFFDV